MFRAAEIMVLDKTDLLPHLDFDDPDIVVLQVSARIGEGRDAWYGRLRELASSAPQRAHASS